MFSATRIVNFKTCTWNRHYPFTLLATIVNSDVIAFFASSILSNYMQHDDLDDDSVKKQNWHLFKGLLKDTAKVGTYR